jgi:high-affinity iron transporter
MFPAFVLALREGLEAALIIGMIQGVLRKVDKREYSGVVWGGVFVATLLSIAAGILLQVLGASFEGKAEEIFEGVTMLLAAGVLTWVIFWMSAQARTRTKKIEEDIQLAAARRSKRVLFGIAFLAVVREGVELALFLTAASFAMDGTQTILGALLGLGSVAVIAWALFSSLLKLDIRKFFLVTSFLLILFAAGLVAHGVHELNEAGWVPAIVEPVWDTNHILDESSGVGELLKALFGYNGNPSLTEVMAYVLFILAVVVGFRIQKGGGRTTAPQARGSV